MMHKITINCEWTGIIAASLPSLQWSICQIKNFQSRNIKKQIKDDLTNVHLNVSIFSVNQDPAFISYKPNVCHPGKVMTISMCDSKEEDTQNRQKLIKLTGHCGFWHLAVLQADERWRRVTWGVPQAELHSLIFQLQAGCVVFKHGGHIGLGSN